MVIQPCCARAGFGFGVTLIRDIPEQDENVTMYVTDVSKSR